MNHRNSSKIVFYVRLPRGHKATRQGWRATQLSWLIRGFCKLWQLLVSSLEGLEWEWGPLFGFFWDLGSSVCSQFQFENNRNLFLVAVFIEPVACLCWLLVLWLIDTLSQDEIQYFVLSSVGLIKYFNLKDNMFTQMVCCWLTTIQALIYKIIPSSLTGSMHFPTSWY